MVFGSLLTYHSSDSALLSGLAEVPAFDFGSG